MSGYYDGADGLPGNARFVAKPWQPQEKNNVLGAASEFAAIQTSAALH
jgi:hypothetical protein